MNPVIHQHRVAQRDLAKLAEYIRRDKPRAALRFLNAARATFDFLLEMRSAGSLYESNNPELVDLRVFPISGFENYLIFYRPVSDGIEVVRVLHGARDIESIFGPAKEDDR